MNPTIQESLSYMLAAIGGQKLPLRERCAVSIVAIATEAYPRKPQALTTIEGDFEQVSAALRELTQQWAQTSAAKKYAEKHNIQDMHKHLLESLGNYDE